MASYKKIRDLTELTTITKDHLIPVASPEGVAGETTGRATASNFMGAVINNSSTFEIDSDGNLKIKAGAITAADISDGAIGTEKLKSTGPGSIDIQNVARKNVIVHIGNYYRRGVKYYGSDAFNFSGGLYGLRTVEVIPWAGNDNHPDPYYGYFVSGSSDEVVEPFATCTAATRYVLHNHGSASNITILVHGHVSWSGTYDIHASHYGILDVGNWGPFLNVGMTAGRHPEDNQPPATNPYAHLDNYANGMSSATAARIDVDCSNLINAIPPGQWFRAPTMYVSGINMVYHGRSDTIQPKWDGGKGAGGFHEIRGMKMQMIGGDYFIPWRIGCPFFFSSGGNQPHEVHTTTANMTVFKIEGRGSGVYSNNATNNPIFLSSDKSNCIVTFAQVSSGANFVFKRSQCHSIPGSTFLTSHNSFTQSGGYSSFTWETEKPGGVDQGSWVPGNSLTYYINQTGGGSTSAADKSSGYYYNLIDGILTTALGSVTGNTDNILANRMTNWTSKSSLTAAIISGSSNLKSNPTSRIGVGGTSSSGAPYADQ